ncbi:hypothetical protein EG359_16625 [Chryseobacterium joostei]|uniref:Uncharacterized protein n=1 Tax=Chryseobacterium joostei TaxID=112234 RepID=A0ABM7BT00_9FLAO|nr:hypothetical protein EG359_16625 [Chryseobacterium joostei]
MFSFPKTWDKNTCRSFIRKR